MNFQDIDAREGNKVGWDAIENVVHDLPDKLKDGNFLYAGVLYGLAALLKPKVVVEIGVQLGISTRMWLAAAPEAKVYSIDIDPDCSSIRKSLKDCDSERWWLHTGSSQNAEPRECDLLYVDGDHSYAVVCADMTRHGPLVRDGGLVVLDDYHVRWPGKQRWVDERWDELDPLIVGPTAIVRVTPAKRQVFTKVFP